MSEFIQWETLGTYGGALAMVLLLTQFTKGLGFLKKVPTQLLSYILALIVLLTATIFTAAYITPAIIVQSFFNAVIVSMASNGAHTAISRISGAG